MTMHICYDQWAVISLLALVYIACGAGKDILSIIFLLSSPQVVRSKTTHVTDCYDSETMKKRLKQQIKCFPKHPKMNFKMAFSYLRKLQSTLGSNDGWATCTIVRLIPQPAKTESLYDSDNCCFIVTKNNVFPSLNKAG